MIEVRDFRELRLRGGFLIVQIDFTEETLEDALGREAIAQTRIIGRELRLRIRKGLSEAELSITLYHEILEAVTVASLRPPSSVLDFNEAGFEDAAQAAHQRWGSASPVNLERLLQFYGFRED